MRRIQDDRVGESAARAALAQAYEAGLHEVVRLREATGDTQEAIKQLENLLSAGNLFNKLHFGCELR